MLRMVPVSVRVTVCHHFLISHLSGRGAKNTVQCFLSHGDKRAKPWKGRYFKSRGALALIAGHSEKNVLVLLA